MRMWRSFSLPSTRSRCGRLSRRRPGNLRGRWQTLPLRLAGEAERLSLAPDASRLAVQWRREGRTQLQVLELGSVLEPDRPAGSRVLGGGAGS